MTPEEIHELGLREVERILGEMNKVRQRVGFQGDLPAFFHVPAQRSEVLLHERHGGDRGIPGT
jgi:uncharacterized protein (DUF885 family)